MTDWEKELNREQLLAVRHTDSPLLVLAGAGSGKTKVLTYRAFYLVNQLGVKPGEIILLTFTNKAAEEMKARVEKMGGFEAPLGFAGTFHTFGARMLRRYGSLIDLPANFVIYDANDAEAAVKMAIKNLGLEPKTNKPGMFLHLMGRLKNELISANDFEASAKDDFGRRLATVYREYQKILTASRAVDFDDLLLDCVKLLSLPTMKEKIKGKYNYVLVDEYQDTNRVQFLLTKLLSTNPDGLMVVGDAAQAIYSFRGADFRNLSLLASEFPNLTTVRLPKNYRSTQTILDAAFGVIGNNLNHPIIKLESVKEFGEKISLAEMTDEKEEAAYVVRIAQKMAASGGSLAVLYRTNAQSRAIEEALIRARIDYKLVGGIRFYDRAEIKDLLAYLRVIVNREDKVSALRIEGLGKRNKAKFEEWLAGSGARLSEKQPQEALEEVMEQTGYLARFDERDEDDAARVENIRELLAVAGEFKTAAEFLESVALIASEDLADRQMRRDGGDRTEAIVTMMTIHSAKGLEFDEVIIAGLEEGLLPHSRSLLEKEELEEERRLMYVAMTRAREKLHLTLTRSRLVFGGRQSSSPSRFLAEIPQELIGIASNGLSYRDLENGKQKEINDWDERRIVPEWESEPTPPGRWPRGGKPDKARVLAESQKDFEEIDAW